METPAVQSGTLPVSRSVLLETVTVVRGLLVARRAHPDPARPGAWQKDVDAGRLLWRELSEGYAPGEEVPHWRLVSRPDSSEDEDYGPDAVPVVLTLRDPLLNLNAAVAMGRWPAAYSGTVRVGAPDAARACVSYALELVGCYEVVKGEDESGGAGLVDSI